MRHARSVLDQKAKLCVGISALLGACVLMWALPTAHGQTGDLIVRPDPAQVDWPVA